MLFIADIPRELFLSFPRTVCAKRKIALGTFEATRQGQTIIPVFNGRLITHQSSRKRCRNTEIGSGKTKRAVTGNRSKYSALLIREIKKCKAKEHPPPREIFFSR
jgi:hypothetical protein